MGLARYDHLPWGRRPELPRSGTYGRALLTQYGRLADLRGSQVRRGNGELRWPTIQRYERCWGPLLAHHLLGACLGLSLRALQEVMSETRGEVVSLSACTRLVWEVDKQGKALPHATIAGPPAVVMVDGLWVNIAYPPGAHRQDAQGRRRAVKRKAKRGGLRALGLWDDGQWESGHGQRAAGENQASWHHCLGELYRKGRTAETPQLIIREGSKGLESALEAHFSRVPHQRGIFPKIKKLADHLVVDDFAVPGAPGDDKAERQARQARKKAIFAEASEVDQSHEEVEIRERAARLRNKGEVRAPQAPAAFFVDFDKTVSSLKGDLPAALLSLIRPPHLLERFHREARRKQRAIGMLPSERGCEVLWYLMAMRETAKQIALAEWRL